MSDLESKLKPILEPLIFDWSSVLASTRGFVSVMAYWIHPAIFQTAAGTAATVCLDNQLDSRGAIQIGSQAARGLDECSGLQCLSSPRQKIDFSALPKGRLL